MPSGEVHAKLSRAQKAEIRRRFADGESPSVLAREYQITRSTVYAVTGGADQRIESLRATPETRALRIQHDYLTASDAAAVLGISRFTMNEYLHAGRFPGAFQIGERSRFWLVPRTAVAARQKGIT